MVLASDRKYLQNLTTVLLSIDKHIHSKKDLRVTVIESDLGRDFKTILSQSFDFEIDFHSFKLPDISLPLNFYSSPLVYARLWIELIPNPSQRLIYLDCDILLQTDISELFNLELQGMVLAATQDAFISSLSHELGPAYLKLDKPYFNSGVLVIDFEEWAKAKVLSSGLGIIKRYGELIRFVDQEVLNCIFQGNFHELDISWNQQTLFRWNPLNLPLNQNLVFCEAAISSPKIVHFNSMQISGNRLIKPWDYPEKDMFANEWLEMSKKAQLLLTGND